METPHEHSSQELDVQRLESLLSGGADELTDEQLARLLLMAVGSAGQRLLDGTELPEADADEQVTATDVVHVCNWLLKVADLEPFELGFWRHFAGSLRTSGGS